MTFTLEHNTPAEVPVQISLAIDSEGDVVIRATDGDTTTDIAYLISHGDKAGQLCLAGAGGDELEELGFQVNDDGEIEHY